MAKSLCVVQVTIPSSGKKRRKTKVCLMMCEQKNGNFYPSPARLLKILHGMEAFQPWWVPHHSTAIQPHASRADYKVFAFPIKEGVVLDGPHYINVPLEAVIAAWGNIPIKH